MASPALSIEIHLGRHARSSPKPGSVTCVALLRGINVGKAKRIAMADLREIVSGLGHQQVRTLLNSGNVVFNVRRPSAARLQLPWLLPCMRRSQRRSGVNTSVTVVTASALDAIVRGNPWPEAALQPSQLLVALHPTPLHLRDWNRSPCKRGRRTVLR